MAEVLAFVASIVAVVDAGLKLSTALYTFADSVYHAKKVLRNIAHDIALTSAVLDELGKLLKKDSNARLCSNGAFTTAEKAIKECENVYAEINVVACKSMKSKTERLKWPFREARMESLRSNLERLKTTLLLLLNVLSYARELTLEYTLFPRALRCLANAEKCACRGFGQTP